MVNEEIFTFLAAPAQFGQHSQILTHKQNIPQGLQHI
jgi:hypothetical protein